MKKIFLVLFCVLTYFNITQAQTIWYDPMNADHPQVMGRGWNDEIGKTYHRLPERAKPNLRKPLYDLSLNSAGMYIKFVTNAKEITVKYNVANIDKSFFNLVSIAHSGIDLYAMDLNGQQNWCSCFGNAGIDKQTVTYHYQNLQYQDTIRGNEYQLFLPLYNTVETLSIGVPQGASFTFSQPDVDKPIVAYGTSITQGASASRPAMAWTNIVQRKTQYPMINLGFSGNGKLEKEMFSLLSEIDARMYIIDCIPNMGPLLKEIYARTIDGVKMLRSKRNVPILLVENAGNMNRVTNPSNEQLYEKCNAELHKAYEELTRLGYKDLYYLSENEIGMLPEGQIDGIHPNDIGMECYANAYVKKIQSIFRWPENNKFTPIQQRRDGTYVWTNRHDEVLTRNNKSNPDVLLIGNSITHYWGGEPLEKIARGQDSWKKLFKGHVATNMGFGWDRIENVYWRLLHGEIDGCQAKHIFLMIGTNNIGINTNEEIVEGIVGLVQLLRERQPQAQIHVVKIFPRRNMEDRVAEINQLLDKKLATDSKISLVDVSSQLLLKDGSGKIDETLFADGLHPNAKGYDKIAKIYHQYLK